MCLKRVKSDLYTCFPYNLTSLTWMWITPGSPAFWGPGHWPLGLPERERDLTATMVEEPTHQSPIQGRHLTHPSRGPRSVPPAKSREKQGSRRTSGTWHVSFSLFPQPNPKEKVGLAPRRKAKLLGCFLWLHGVPLLASVPGAPRTVPETDSLLATTWAGPVSPTPPEVLQARTGQEGAIEENGKHGNCSIQSWLWIVMREHVAG